MRLPENKWSNTDNARGVLFFAQQMREMLTPQTFESFRAMSLDTIARLRECRRVLSDFERGTITEATLAPFLSELEWSLEHDPVARLKEPRLADLYVDRLRDKKQPPASLAPVVASLLKRLKPVYKKSLETAITQDFNNNSRRSRLKTLTSFYCSHLLNTGYSRPFILDSVKAAFFSRPMLRAGPATLNAFFGRFNGEQRTYRVFVMTDRRFANSIGGIGATKHQYTALPAQVRTAFSAFPRTPISRWIEVEAPAIDIYGAADLVEFMLNSAQSINYLGPQIDGYTWSDERYVTTPRASSGRLIVAPSAERVKHKRRTGTKASPIAFANTIKTVLGQLDESSTSRLLNSLNTSDISGRHITPQTRLISLWSSVEVLLSDPPKGTARILHYERNLIPCICLKYMRRNIAAVFDELRITYKAKLIKIVTAEPDFPDKDYHTRFASIIIKPGNKALRDALLTMCSSNPLALYRLYRLWKECSTPKGFRDAVVEHERRVRWQIYRIYRARNTLVHAGMSPTHLPSLVQNIFEYYKSAVWTVLGHVRKESGRSRLADAVEEIGVEYEVFKATLNEMAGRPLFTDGEMLAVVHAK